MVSNIIRKNDPPSGLFLRIKSILETARTNVARSVNTTQVIANWFIGREIVEEEQRGKKRANYGRQLLRDLSTKLKTNFGSGYSVDNLELFRRFYFEYPLLISDAVPRKSILSVNRQFHLTNIRWIPGILNPNLSWTHYRSLLRISNKEVRSFYEIEVTKNYWSSRELERQIHSLLFERLAKSKDKAGLMRLSCKGQEIQKPEDIFKDPMVIEFLGLPESPKLIESELEQALINNLKDFLLEMGKGFAFIGRQERLSLDGDHFYVDLVFYHVILKCYVLIDLKVGKLTHADLGQLQLYVNYYDQEKLSLGDNPTLGLILCTDKNDSMVKYMLGSDKQKKIFTSRYQFHLPTVTELENEMRRELKEIKK